MEPFFFPEVQNSLLRGVPIPESCTTAFLYQLVRKYSHSGELQLDCVQIIKLFDARFDF